MSKSAMKKTQRASRPKWKPRPLQPPAEQLAMQLLEAAGRRQEEEVEERSRGTAQLCAPFAHAQTCFAMMDDLLHLS
jgi:hypothetical protein